MPRSRALFTAPIVLAIVIAGIFAIRSRNNDNSDVSTTPNRDCSPVARADAVATKPTTPISIDVLANDTDADGDPLVFQILKTTGGDSAIDDGGTPTDASDDRVLFTPADPTPETATIEYQAVDPNGAVGEALVTVSINAAGALPAGSHSESVDETAGKSGDCGGTPRSTSTTGGTSTVTSSPPYTGSVTNTTVKSSKKKSSRGNTTPTRARNVTVGGSPTTKAPASNTTRPTTATTAKPATTTTQPSGPPPTTPPECGAFPSNGSDEEQDAWRQCVRDHAGG